MGPSQSADYSHSLHFVQNLNDQNFGEVQIFRNDQGKFIMKCTKSFLTGDKRHSDFTKILQFISHTPTKNILKVYHLEQYHESNVCIEYEKVLVYTEYLNFTLKGLIVNKKRIDEEEMWYLIKSMLEVMKQLQENKLKIVFSLDNIFLTLKGIPSVFLYHFFSDEKEPDNKIQTKKEENCFEMRPESMGFSLGVILMQLFNMELIEKCESFEYNSQEVIKNQLFHVSKKNNQIGRIIRLILTEQNPSEILKEIQKLEQSEQINVSTEIRFNKFRYVVANEESNSSAAKKNNILKDLTQKDTQFNNEFKSRPLSAVNTPIYRLRQNQIKENEQRNLSIKNNKIIKPQQNYFKHKKTQKPQQQEEKCHSVSHENQNFAQKTLGIRGNSKLTLISRKNLSASKLDTKLPTKQIEETSSQKAQEKSIKKEKESQEKQSKQKNTVRASNRIKEILNEELSKSRQSYKNYTNKAFLYSKGSSHDFSNPLIKPTAVINKNNKTMPSKNFFSKISKDRESEGKKDHSQNQTLQSQAPLMLNTKTEQNEPQQKSIMYKPFVTEHNYEEIHEIKQQSIKALLGLSQFNSTNSLSKNKDQENSKESMSSSICINALDKSNFLSTLEMKKSINNLKVKNISQKKNLILSNLNQFNTQNQNEHESFQEDQEEKTCIRSYLSKKQSTNQSCQQTRKNSANPTSRVSGLIDISISAIKDQENRTGFEKNKNKFKIDSFNKMNKENTPLNVEIKETNNSKVRKLSIRSKPQNS